MRSISCPSTLRHENAKILLFEKKKVRLICCVKPCNALAFSAGLIKCASNMDLQEGKH